MKDFLGQDSSNFSHAIVGLGWRIRLGEITKKTKKTATIKGRGGFSYTARQADNHNVIFVPEPKPSVSLGVWYHDIRNEPLNVGDDVIINVSLNPKFVKYVFGKITKLYNDSGECRNHDSVDVEYLRHEYKGEKYFSKKFVSSVDVLKIDFFKNENPELFL